MSEPTEQELRAEALEALLIEKGVLKPEFVDEVLQRYNERVGPMNGAQVVARAWTDSTFKAELLSDATAAIEDYAFEGGQVEKLVVVENTDDVHNVVVCTLCSCYPWALLGLPPAWYKDPAYRSRIVREPRAVLQEFGLEVPASKEVRVWDSSAEVRYLVLPQVPDDLANKNKADLEPAVIAERVSRNSMIGVEVCE